MQLKSIFILMFILLIPFAAAAEMMSVRFSGTEMRSKPNAMASDVISTLTPGTPLIITEKKADYYEVKDFRGRSGWVHRALLSEDRGVVISAESANVRQGPGTDNPILFKLDKGTAAKFLSKQDKWVQLQLANGKTGWVAEFLVWGD